MKVSKQRYAGLVVKSFLLGTLAIAVSMIPALQNEAQADKEIVLAGACPGCGWKACVCWPPPGIRKNTRSDFARHRHGGKQSPKIAGGMVDILENVIAGRTRSDDRFELVDAILMALEFGEIEVATELLDELDPRLGRPPVRR